MMYKAGKERCEITVTSDASGRWGCGTFCRRVVLVAVAGGGK